MATSEVSAKKRVVVVGGGTGSHTLLKGLRKFSTIIDIDAIVTMADSGGSTGRLRDEFGSLPVGDARMALAALAADVDAHDELVRELFLYRFDKGEGLSGHNFGNLLLTALTEILGSEEAAIESASRILRVRGRVLPVTTDHSQLQAVYEDGTVVVGEHEIDEPPTNRWGQRIAQLSLNPRARLTASAEESLLRADLIVLGPGDLYTSILANSVVDGFVDALARSKARVVYVCNLMAKHSQTKGMHAQEHVDEVTRYIGRVPDVVLVNNAPISERMIDRYKDKDDHPVLNNCAGDTCTIAAIPLLAEGTFTTAKGDILKRSFVRHDPEKLATAILNLL